jgi:dTMP kinase
MPDRTSGVFIAFEGGDGAGKSTQARRLADRLRADGYDAVLTQEPAGTPIGRLVKEVFERRARDPDAPPLSPVTEMFLFQTARADHVRTVIRPALDAGRVVVCDRYADSTVAYQAYGRGLPLDDVLAVERVATGGLAPDLTVLLDVPPEVALARADRSPGGAVQKALDSIGQEPLDFHRRVREGFLDLARTRGRLYEIIDATQPQEEVARAVEARVRRLLEGR